MSKYWFFQAAKAGNQRAQVCLTASVKAGFSSEEIAAVDVYRQQLTAKFPKVTTSNSSSYSLEYLNWLNEQVKKTNNPLLRASIGPVILHRQMSNVTE